MKKWGEKKGGTRRIGDVPAQHFCKDPQHRPPSHMVFRPGVYEHECPSCGKITRFTVNPPTLRCPMGSDQPETGHRWTRG